MKRFICILYLLITNSWGSLLGFYTDNPNGKDAIEIGDHKIRIQRILDESIDSIGLVYDVDFWFLRVFVSGKNTNDLENHQIIFHTGERIASEIRFRDLTGLDARVRGQKPKSSYEISVQMNSLAEALQVCSLLLKHVKLPDECFFAEDAWKAK